MATPIADPNKKPTDSGENTNQEFEKVYEKINVDEIDTSGLEIATTMDATNAALLQQVEKKVDTSTKNPIPEIPDIAAYIAATKEATKEKEKLPAQLLAMDGTDLSKLPGAYAVVPHQKGDHKVVFLRSQAPADLLNDPKNRTKGSVYQKDGADIYKVSVDMKQHTTLRNTEGKPLDVWVIDDPKDLDDQIQAIYSGKGGGTNFGMPVKVSLDTQVSVPVQPIQKKQPEPKKEKAAQPKAEEIPTPKTETLVEKKELPTKDDQTKEAKTLDAPTDKKVSSTKENKKDTPPTKPIQANRNEVKPKQTEEQAQASMDDARKAMKEKMHAQLAPSTPVIETPIPTVKKDKEPAVQPTPAPKVEKPISQPVPKDLPKPSTEKITPAKKTPTTTPVVEKKEPIEKKEMPVPKNPVVKTPVAPIQKQEPITKPTPAITKPTPKIETPAVTPKTLTPQPAAEKIVTPLPPTPPVENKTLETISLEPPYEQPAPSFPVFNIDTMSAPATKPTAPSAPIETLVGQKSLEAEPSKAPSEKAPKTIEQMLEQQAKPNLQDVLSTSKPAPTAAASKTPTKTRKPLLALSKKQRLGILIVLVLIVGRIGWVMFGNNGGGAPIDQPNDQVDGNDVENPTPDVEGNTDGEGNPDDTENQDNEQPTDGEEPVGEPTDEKPKDDEPKTTFTMAELVAKLESIQVEARKTVNEARKVSNREAIKFSVAALQKATSTLESIETDTKLTADQVQQDATRADKYLQDALALLEDNAN